MKKVIVCDKLSEKALEMLKEEQDLEISVRTGLSEDELCQVIPEFHGVIVRSATKLTAKVLASGTNLQVAVRAGIGVDNIDCDAATRHGIVVMNTPGGNIVTTAEHTLSLLLSLARHIPQATASMKDGKWEKNAFTGWELTGKTLAVIGLGRIGKEVAKRGKGLGLNVIAYDPYLRPEQAQALGVTMLPLQEVFRQGDIFTLHVPASDETHHLINDAAFEVMKPKVLIVNCARGGLVDEAALIRALDSGKVAGAALDVFEQEPPKSGVSAQVAAHPKVICTPHLGASTFEAQEKVGYDSVTQMKDALLRGLFTNTVNLPTVDWETFQKFQPYLELSTAMAQFAAQIMPEPVEKIEVEYSGDLAKMDTALLTRAVVRGYLSYVLHERVTYVNAEMLAEGRGIAIKAGQTSENTNFSSLMTVTMWGKSAHRRLSGAIFGGQPKIVRLDEFFLDMTPSKSMLYFENVDHPGVIGRIGTFLGGKNINIGSMALGRVNSRGKAISILALDEAVGSDTVEEIRNLPDMLDVRAITLEIQ